MLSTRAVISLPGDYFLLFISKNHPRIRSNLTQIISYFIMNLNSNRKPHEVRARVGKPRTQTHNFFFKFEQKNSLLINFLSQTEKPTVSIQGNIDTLKQLQDDLPDYILSQFFRLRDSEMVD